MELVLVFVGNFGV